MGGPVDGIDVADLSAQFVGRRPLGLDLDEAGLQPAGGYLPQDVQRDDCGHVIVDASMATSVPGIYAAGALRAGYGGQVADAMDDGERAAAAVQDFLRREL